MEYIKLNDGLEIPAIGFGTFMIPADGRQRSRKRRYLDYIKIMATGLRI